MGLCGIEIVFIGYYLFLLVNILIAGAGSIGSVVGILLAENHDVTLLRRSTPGRKTQKTNASITGTISVSSSVEISYIDDLKRGNKRFDVIYIASQSQDTEILGNQIQPIVHERAPIVSLQNGVKNEAILKQIFPNNPLILASVWWSATLVDATNVYYDAVGTTYIGLPSSDMDSEGFTKMLNLVHTQLEELPEDSFKVVLLENIEEMLYQKLALNILAPTSALVRIPLWDCLNIPELRRLTHYVFEEALQIVNQAGHSIENEGLDGLRTMLSRPPTEKAPRYEDFIDHPKKASTQISAEKYGGKGSNVKFLLGELEELGDKHGAKHDFITLVRKEIEAFEPNYKPLTTTQLADMIEKHPPPSTNL